MEERLSGRKWAIVLAFAFVGWAFCTAVMVIGMALLPLQTALIAHAIAAPIFFGAVSFIYYVRFGYTSPLQTAVIFTAFVVLTDFFVVALLVNRSLEMFASVLGTWLPFALIFTGTYLTGTLLVKVGRVQPA